MRKKVCSAIAACLLALLCTGCGTSVPLGERAIVKAIYLDEDKRGGAVQAVLAVQVCKPSANAAEAQSEMQLYTGTGESIATAIYDAERQQNKKPFYAQNRLLFLGEGTLRAGVSNYLSYFGAEEVSRTSLSVFVLPMTAQELTDSEDSIETVVAEGERLADTSTAEGNHSTGIYEMHFTPEGSFTGYLPVLQVNQEKNTLAQVTQLLFVDADRPLALAENAQLQLALLFSGKAKRMTSYLTLDGTETVLRTQSIFVQRELTGAVGDRRMRVTLRGKLESASQNGRLLQGDALAQALDAYNLYLVRACETLYQTGFYQGADLFGDIWWFLQDDTAATRSLQRQNRFYAPKRIAFSAKLESA